jgi:hypothetical protein
MIKKETPVTYEAIGRLFVVLGKIIVITSAVLFWYGLLLGGIRCEAIGWIISTGETTSVSCDGVPYEKARHSVVK